MAFDPSTAKPINSAFDPSTAKFVPSQPVENVSEPAPSSMLDSPIAFGKGLVRGVGDAALDFGDLVADALSSFETTKSAGEGLKKYTKDDIQPSEVELQNPISSSIGAGIGYSVPMLVAPGSAVRGAEAAVKTTGIGSKLAQATPGIVGGALREGSVGALQGAAMAESGERSGGALLGGAIGAPLGAIGAGIGQASRAGNELVAPEIQRMKGLGYRLDDPETMASARQSLAARGEQGLQSNIEERIVKMSQKEIDKLRPDGSYVPGKSPNQVLRDKETKSFAEADAMRKDLYEPLTLSTGTINISSLLSASNRLSKQGKNFLPEVSNKPKGVEASFSQLQDYRQALDGSIKSAKNAARNGTLNNKDLHALYDIRKQTTNLMEETATKQGLGDQFLKADAFYKDHILPFKTFTKSGKISSPEEIDQTWTTINSLMNQTTPPVTKLKNLVTTLGDEGKDLVGWALLQSSMDKAITGGSISLNNFNGSINKFRSSGLGDIIDNPTYKQAVEGINRIVKDGKDSLNIKLNRIYIPLVTPVLEHLLQTEKGIKLLYKIGGADKNSEAARTAIQSLFSGLPNIGAQNAMNNGETSGN